MMPKHHFTLKTVVNNSVTSSEKEGKADAVETIEQTIVHDKTKSHYTRYGIGHTTHSACLRRLGLTLLLVH